MTKNKSYTRNGTHTPENRESKINLYETLHANTIRQANISRIAGILANCSGAALGVSALMYLLGENNAPKPYQLTFAALLFLLGYGAKQSAARMEKEAKKYRKKIQKLQHHR